ncbi:MAG: hypothetical protein XE07_0522 [Methanothrix harundinacea]|jgi:SAM-dependent methyltransferase|uniref:Methyltransferase type 11 domain-containing protein n=1 Tax=Methanothrix harundinacea TaxID=301375 RepID=A0A117MCY0_9EURY|nr:MAG: hypothetical protein XE07_0522 [Methanothrix harundinacea]
MDARDRDNFWCKRAENYDELFWTKDEGYLDTIINVSNFKFEDLVLDVGVGTGAVAKRIKPYVKHVIGIDISGSMIEKCRSEGISIIKWDICEALFANKIFDKVVARMVFHHILDDLDLAIMRCYELLKNNGKIIVAEGLPPSNDPDVIEWYKNMFKLKEERLTFTCEDLIDRLSKAGFNNICAYEYRMAEFSIKNWLINSGIEKENQDKIMEMHLSADEKIKSVYNAKYVNGDCFVDTKNIIIVAEK